MDRSDLNIVKICKDCGKELPISSFHTTRKGSKVVRAHCKDCENTRSYNYRKTKEGVVTQIYHMQKQSSKERGHPLPAYSKEQLKTWIFLHPDFESLYNTWVASGYVKDYAPSCDRIDTLKPYSLGNIQLVAFKQNHLNENRDMRKGIIGKAKKVEGIYRPTGRKVSFVSASEAQRQIGIQKNHINDCCLGKRISAGNYTWRFI